MSNQTPIVRFPLAQRIEHFILIFSFGLLGVTGLAQMFNHLAISQAVLTLFGGIASVRIIHRICATILMFETLYHIVLAGYKVFVLRTPLTMLPQPKDAVDIWHSITYNLGLRKDAPKMGRYNYGEKMEYWFMMWGLLIMGITGYMLWNPITTTKYLPGVIIPAAKIAHGWEAVLAVAAIIVWHFYNVHLKSFNSSMFTGKMSVEHMEEEHAHELEQICAGTAYNKPSAAQIAARRKIYLPIAAVFSAVFLAAIYFFVAGEQTAITTVPKRPESVVVFSPQTPTPLPTMAPIPTTVAMPSGGGDATWTNGIGSLFSGKCGACHGTMGGFSVKTYADLMKGSANGAIIVAEDSAGSPLIQLMEKGGHPGSFAPRRA